MTRKELKLPDEIAAKADKLAAKRDTTFTGLVVDLLIRELGDNGLRKHVRTVGRPKNPISQRMKE